MQLANWLKSEWKEAAMLALLAALLLEGGCNVLSGRTVWHRLGELEQSVKDLQHEKELEEQRTRLQLDDLREKSAKNAEQVEKVEEKVEKKKVTH